MKNNIIHRSLLAQYEELQMEGYPDILAEMIDSFLNTSPIRIEKIQFEISRSNWSQVAFCAHTLKSSALTLGALKLGDFCEKIEELAKSPNSSDLIPKLIPEMIKVYEISYQELKLIRNQRTRLKLAS